MKLELKENMYVRTKDGYISQYKYYDTTNIGKLLCIPLSNGTFANIEDIVKTSYNIIDILEKGDCVNGVEVENIDDEQITMSDMQVPILKSIANGMIKSVITHEQMEQMAYKVGEWLNEMVFNTKQTRWL